MFKMYDYFKGEKKEESLRPVYTCDFCAVFVALFNAIFVALELGTKIAIVK